MTRGGYRLTAAADADIAAVLRESGQRFGPRQRTRYAALIEAAIAMVAAAPARAGSRARPELGEDVRSFHLELAARRRGAAAHRLYYVAAPFTEPHAILVLRLLHERMDPALHLPPDAD